MRVPSADTYEQGDGDGGEAGDGGEVAYGDFEDLETGEVFAAGMGDVPKHIDSGDDDDESEGQGPGRGVQRSKGKKAQVLAEDGEEEVVEGEGGEGGDGRSDADKQAELMKKKLDSKKRFDNVYDGIEENEELVKTRQEMDAQKKLNIEEFEEDDPEARTSYTGVRPGAYCRVKLSGVPCEFVKHFDPRRLVLLGGLTAQEESFGFVQVRLFRSLALSLALALSVARSLSRARSLSLRRRRALASCRCGNSTSTTNSHNIVMHMHTHDHTRSHNSYPFVQVRIKKHRWHKKILKNNDPLIFSVGWRRFQSVHVLYIPRVLCIMNNV
jgi:hypothetical protein